MFNWNIESNNHFLEIKNKHPEWTCQQIASNFLCMYLFAFNLEYYYKLQDTLITLNWEKKFKITIICIIIFKMLNMFLNV